LTTPLDQRTIGPDHLSGSLVINIVYLSALAAGFFLSKAGQLAAGSSKQANRAGELGKPPQRRSGRGREGGVGESRARAPHELPSYGSALMVT
jgi:hypothetical protein